MLEDHGLEFTYREYRKDALTVAELRRVLGELGLAARAVLRTRDKANGELGLTGEEGEEALLAAMAEHPTLLQRPIGRKDGRAVVGRPVEALLELA